MDSSTSASSSRLRQAEAERHRQTQWDRTECLAVGAGKDNRIVAVVATTEAAFMDQAMVVVADAQQVGQTGGAAVVVGNDMVHVAAGGIDHAAGEAARSIPRPDQVAQRIAGVAGLPE